MRLEELTANDLKQLNIMANVAAGRVETSLERWIKKKVHLKIVSVSVEDFNTIAKMLGGPDSIAAASVMGIEGDLEGVTGFIFPQRDALSMVDLLRKRPVGTTTTMDEVSQSVLNETCNIVGSTFLNELVADMGLKMLPTAPLFCFDLVGSVLEPLLVEYAVVGDSALIFETQFEEETDKIGGFFFLFPEPDHIPRLLKSFSGAGA